MAPNEPRKSLTERVADRKAGIKQAPDRTPRQKAVRSRLEMFGTVLAMFGLFMLAYTVYKSAGSNSWANDSLVMYCVIFVVGRALKAASGALSRLF
jgi:hypothetical protein